MKDVFKEIKDYFKRTAEDVLQKELDANPTTLYRLYVLLSYPFLFTTNITYTALFISLAGFVLSCGMIIFWIAQGLVRNAFFILPFLVMVVSLSGIWNYKDTRYYTLLPIHVRGEFYNIYIRLRRELFDEANTSQHHVIRHFRSDKQVFSFRKGSVAAGKSFSQ
ncbi:hypothetical protein BC829DRAFT_398937 [Chytridium lagenaria]|nr:hypothetical protein BC829DRAFT_398937 [Chytridium lagenaria]